MQKESLNFPDQHHLQRVIQPALQQVEQQHSRRFLKRKIRFYLFFPPINKRRQTFIIIPVSWHPKHLSWERHFLAITSRHRGWDRMHLFHPQLLQLISSTFLLFLPPSTSYYPPLKALSFLSPLVRWEERIFSYLSTAGLNWTGSLQGCSSLPPAPRTEQDCPCLLPQVAELAKTLGWKYFLQVGRPHRSPRQPCAPCVPCHTENCPAQPGGTLMFWACSSFPLISL